MAIVIVYIWKLRQSFFSQPSIFLSFLCIFSHSIPSLVSFLASLSFMDFNWGYVFKFLKHYRTQVYIFNISLNNI